MCRVYNKLRPLDNVIKHLNSNHIYKFKTLHEILAFQKNYSISVNELLAEHKILIEKEIEKLNTEIPIIQSNIERIKTETCKQIELQIESLQQKINIIKKDKYSFLLNPLKYLKTAILKYNIQHILKNKENKIAISVLKENKNLNAKTLRLGFIRDNISEAVKLNCQSELKELVHCNKVINDAMPIIQGAIGELKVIEELEKLNDNYILFNDFRCNFNPPIYYQEENDHIISIQADHIIISQSGIFLIETKNWSVASMNNQILRSPIKQIRRTGYALFCLINNNRTWWWHSHKWGNVKVPVRNIIVFTNKKPSEEFQYVKIIQTNELQSYITYFKPVFSIEQIDAIASYLKSEMD